MKKISILLAASMMMSFVTVPAAAREPGDGPRYERPEKPEKPVRAETPEKPDRPDTAGERIAKGAATRAVRIGVGEAIGGAVGGAISGGALGGFIGTILTPTKLGCAALHGC